MRPWLALWFLGVAACTTCAAQDDLDAGCDDDYQLAQLPRSQRSVPVAVPLSLVATGMLSRRSALENNFMRFGRSAPRPARADNAVRFGRSPGAAGQAGTPGAAGMAAAEVERVARGGDHNSNGFIRFGRSKAAKDNYMRFGRGGTGSGSGSDDNYVRFGRPDRQSNFVRFGRSDASNFVRFGRSDGSNFVRFGREPSNYLRFGRGDASNFVRFGRSGELEEEQLVEDQDDDVVRDARSKQQKDNYMRFGRAEAGEANGTEKRAKDGFVRFGRDKTDFVRFGRGGGGAAGGSSNFVRFGRSYVDEDESVEGETARGQDDSRTKLGA